MEDVCSPVMATARPKPRKASTPYSMPPPVSHELDPFTGLVRSPRKVTPRSSLGLTTWDDAMPVASMRPTIRAMRHRLFATLEPMTCSERFLARSSRALLPYDRLILDPLSTAL